MVTILPYTDNKPAFIVVCTNKNVPILAAERIGRWSVHLSGYDFDIGFHKGKENANAGNLAMYIYFKHNTV